MTRNQKIALMLGWTVTEVGDRYYRIADPAGKEYKRIVGGIAWSHWPIWTFDERAQAVEPLPFPDYDDNADLAIRLPLEEGAELSVNVFGSVTAARVRITVSSSSIDCDPPYHTSENPAEAICEAWLAYKTRRMV